MPDCVLDGVWSCGVSVIRCNQAGQVKAGVDAN